MKYTHIACGGTFDFFHIGHVAFLKKAFLLSEQVSIGITSDQFANILGKHPYNNYLSRKSIVEKFLNSEKLLGGSTVIKLDDIFGITISDGTLQAIIVTENTMDGALKINATRRNSGLDTLDIIECKLKKSDDGLQISSTRIRSGEISPQGVNYSKFLKKHNFVLPKKLRPILAKPFGEIVSRRTRTEDANLLVAVGDQTTKDLLSAGIVPDVSVVDYKIQRIRSFQSYVDLGFDPTVKVFRAKNPQGFISKNLSETLEKSLRCKSKCVVVVDGEEDLAVLPAVLLSPMGTSVYYGLRDKGLVKISVDLERKNNFWTLLNRFSFG